MLNYCPKYVTNRAIAGYLLALVLVVILFSSATMPFYLYFWGIVTMLCFFYGSNVLTKSWANLPVITFERKLLLTAFLLRFLYVVFIYIFNNLHYGHFYESNLADIEWYMESGEYIANMFRHGDFTAMATYTSWGVAVDDMGYNLYLAILYVLSFSASPVFLPLVLKALWGALTCRIIYRFSKRHFSDGISRMAAIFCALQFNMIWWCGSMMKETEMVLLCAWALDFTDRLFYMPKVKPGAIVGAVLLISSLLLFRTVMVAVIITALVFNVLFGSGKSYSGVRRLGATLMVCVLLLGTVVLNLNQTANDLVETAFEGEHQQTNMAWRAEREGGNSLAVYAGAAVFAPLIFTIPFPTLIYTQEDQEMLMQVAGGNYSKNILSFFVILALLSLLLTGKWRDHALPIAYVCGYLVVLALSEFAQSGRYHMPSLPFEMIFAAYGVSLLNKRTAKFYGLFVAIIVVACVGWSWFKLRGRGLA